MSNRLDKEREAKLQPERMSYAFAQLTLAGKEVTKVDETTLKFYHNGHVVTFFPYSGWHSGRSIKDGRGLHNLLKQIS